MWLDLVQPFLEVLEDVSRIGWCILQRELYSCTMRRIPTSRWRQCEGNYVAQPFICRIKTEVKMTAVNFRSRRDLENAFESDSCFETDSLSTLHSSVLFIMTAHPYGLCIQQRLL